MFKWIFRIIVFLALMVGLAGIFLVYVFASSMASPDPQPAVVQPVKLQEFKVSAEKKVELEQLIEAKKKAAASQLSQLENQEKLLGNKKAEVANTITVESKIIRNIYQAQVDYQQKILQEQLVDFKDKKEEEYKEKALVKKELLEKKLSGMIAQVKQDQVEALARKKNEIYEEYYPDLLNLNLKLKVLKLNDEQQSGYEEQIKKLEKEREAAVKKAAGEIEKEFQDRIEQLKQQFDQDYADYQQELQQEISSLVDKKQQENKEKLQQYTVEQQKQLDQEIDQKRQELTEQNRDELDRLQGIVDQLDKEYNRLRSELAKLEKEAGSY